MTITMSTVLQQTTRTTRSGTRVVTASSSNTSLRSTATSTTTTTTTTTTRTPVQRDVKTRTLSLRDPRASARIDTRAPVQKNSRARTPILRETRSKRELVSPAPASAVSASVSASASALALASTSTSSLPTLVTDVAAAHAIGVRSPSPDPPPTGVLEGPSPLALFVTNIKLLKLDSLPDWPRITTQTFVPPGPGTQGQRRRIHCAEWVFFQLFNLWDPEEAESKLKPFYPPVDQNQSVEFRAALLKSLERAKKMGALSRDAIVRKSALDDCKAERLEEILASFSTTVLKKVVVEKHATTGARMSPILGIATQNLGRNADKMELSALTLTYKSSLKKMVEQKEATRVRYRDFANLLDLKEQDIARRNDAIFAEEIKGTDQWVSDNGRADMRHILRSNWSGNNVWMEAFFSGDSKGAGLMSTPFDTVWEKLHRGQLGELETEGTGLLQQLETRVRVQNERLQKWNAFRQDTFGHSAAATQSKIKVASAPSKGFDLGFEDHRHLQVGKVHRLSLKTRVQEVGMSADYTDIISSLNDDLARISQKDVDLAKLLAERLPKKEEKFRQRSKSAHSVDDDSASEISELDDAEGALLSDIHLPSFQDKSSGSSGPSIRPRLSRPDLLSISVEGSSGPAMNLGKRNFPGKSSYDLDQLDSYDVSTPPTPPREIQPTTPKSKSRKPYKLGKNDSSGPILTNRLVVSPTQYLADNDDDDDGDDALNAVGITSPSPVKQSPSPVKRTKPRHTLSLTERTQLSLTRKSSFFLEDDEPDLVHEPASICSSTVDHTPEEMDSRAPSTEMADDLVSRTQRSMAGFEKAQQKAQLERRRSQRRGKTLPRKESGYFSRGDEDLISLVERLAEEEDMEAVFRSRPKIAQASPAKGWGVYPDYYA